MNGASWTVHPIEYTGTDGTSTGSLFDDPQRLRDDWRRALDGMRAHAALPADRQAAVIALAQTKLAALDQATEHPEEPVNRTDEDAAAVADAIIGHDQKNADATVWDHARVAVDELDAYGRLAVAIPEHLRGDGPCRDCRTEDNIAWFTDSTFWNHVVGGEQATDDPGGILCIPCFTNQAANAGYRVRAWRLLPEWQRETEREDRGAWQDWMVIGACFAAAVGYVVALVVPL